jgi:thymidine kinase
MYAGKSTALLNVGAAYCAAGWGVVVVRFAEDDRDGEAATHIETHDGHMSPTAQCSLDGVFHVRASCFDDIAVHVARIRDVITRSHTPTASPVAWVVLVDEGQFFSPAPDPDSDSMSAVWALAAAMRGHVWVACLNLDKNLQPWGPTRDLATRAVWSRMLYATCCAPDCGRPAWCSHLVHSTDTDTDTTSNYVEVDSKTAPKYEARCTSHMPRLSALWEPHLALHAKLAGQARGRRGVTAQRVGGWMCQGIITLAAAIVVGWSLVEYAMRNKTR